MGDIVDLKNAKYLVNESIHSLENLEFLTHKHKKVCN